jgi:hypothetical protein
MLRRGGSGRPSSSMRSGNADDGAGGQRHTTDVYAVLHVENRHDAESLLSPDKNVVPQNL